jgi:hypothetical protein
MEKSAPPVGRKGIVQEEKDSRENPTGPGL